MTVIRKLMPHERALYAAHLKALSRTDRYARFTGTVSDDSIDAHCAKIDWTRTIVIGALHTGQLVGAAELTALAPLWRPGRAELAVSVLSEHQGAGVGTALVRRAMTIARNRRLTSVAMICLLDNARVQRIAKSLSGSVRRDDGDAVSELKPGWPSQLSILVELFEDVSAAVTSISERWRMSGALSSR